MKSLFNCLLEPSVKNLNVDGVERLSVHEGILANKRMLREVFKEFHHVFRQLDEEYLTGEGSRIELGAGIAPIRDSYPDVLATDIVYSKHLDRVLDAEEMDLLDDSVRVFYGQNCFHHFPHPERFFCELERVLQAGGGAILLEPYYGPFATFLFKRLFKAEDFDKSVSTWEVPVEGPMRGANQALSYIVFVRDRLEFNRRFPNLTVVHQQPCGNYLKYLLSGGLNFRQLCPDWAIPIISVLQWTLSPFASWLSIHHIIVLRKKSE